MDEIIRKMGTALPSLVLISGLLAGQTNIASADANGRAGRSGATGSTCASCHSLAASGTTVEFGVAGGSVPATVVANSVNVLTFTVKGGPAVNAGLAINASAGALSATGTGTKILSSEVVHSAPTTPFPTTGVVYSFTWTAPATPGTVTIYGAGVSGDGIAGESADGAANTSISIMVTPAANVAPIARITGPTTGTVGTPVSFDGSTSTDADGSIADYAWNFGDNTAGAGPTPSAHTYAAPGTYHVTLVVTDNLGLISATTTHDIVISAVGTHLAPVVNANGPYTGTVGTPVVFSSAGSSVDSGLTATYSWDFGDTSTPATVANPSHTYLTAGTYTVKLTVTDSATTPLSTTVSTSATITAATPPPVSTGQQLYDDNCASCHGPKAGPAGDAGSVVGESADDIREAIEEVTEMQSLSSLSHAQISAIASYLRKVSKGEQLYIDNCESCHGPGGAGGDEPAVIGASKKLIKEEINTEPEMASLQFLLTQDDAIEDIAKFLKQDEEDDLVAKANDATGAGGLDWLTLAGLGAWGFKRRRK